MRGKNNGNDNAYVNVLPMALPAVLLASSGRRCRVGDDDSSGQLCLYRSNHMYMYETNLK